jgi:hypothetical protein
MRQGSLLEMLISLHPLGGPLLEREYYNSYAIVFFEGRHYVMTTRVKV